MGQIKVMDRSLASKVAAGEVITRPVNVIKELIENSIDAGSTNIRVDLKNGGKRLIRVTDNGKGMDREDLELCVQSHATSKIERLEDFASLHSFGFRGEALASITAVSKLAITSMQEGQESGNRLTQEGAGQASVVAYPATPGTAVEIRELFYNIPARLKFLKSDQYEKSLVVDLIQSFMAIRPEISFALFHNEDRMLLSSGSGKMQELLPVLFGNSMGASMVEIKEKKHPILGVRIRGYLSHPSSYRSNSKDLKVFINQRIIKHPGINKAILQAYDQVIPQRKWPLGLFFIEVPPPMIDVNVHPMKMEVRLENEAILLEFITKSIKPALFSKDLSTTAKQSLPTSFVNANKNPDLTKTISFMSRLENSKPEPTPNLVSELSQVQENVREQPRSFKEIERDSVSPPVLGAEAVQPSLVVQPVFDVQAKQEVIPQVANVVPGPESGPSGSLARLELTEDSVETSLGEEQRQIAMEEYRVLGQLGNTFIILETTEDMVLVDQHVAQERILFEYFLGLLQRRSVQNAQRLLIPARLAMSAGMLSLASQFQEELKHLGFETQVHDTEVEILAVPDPIKGDFSPDFFEELLSSFEMNMASNRIEDYYKEIAETMACKGSIKAGDELSPVEMERLVNDLMQCENPYRCPHGRPVIVKYALKDVYRKFDRNFKKKS